MVELSTERVMQLMPHILRGMSHDRNFSSKERDSLKRMSVQLIRLERMRKFVNDMNFMGIRIRDIVQLEPAHTMSRTRRKFHGLSVARVYENLIGAVVLKDGRTVNFPRYYDLSEDGDDSLELRCSHCRSNDPAGLNMAVTGWICNACMPVFKQALKDTDDKRWRRCISKLDAEALAIIRERMQELKPVKEQD